MARTKETVFAMLDTMSMNKVLALHREYAVKHDEMFLRGTASELSKVDELLDWIEQYICSKCQR